MNPLLSAFYAILFILSSLPLWKSKEEPVFVLCYRPKASESFMYYLSFAWLITCVSLFCVFNSPASSFFLKISSALFIFYSMTSEARPSASNFSRNSRLFIIIYLLRSCSIIYWLAFLGGAILAFYLSILILFWPRVPSGILISYAIFAGWDWRSIVYNPKFLILLGSGDLSRCTFYYKNM